jgi:hypothetical protein
MNSSIGGERSDQETLAEQGLEEPMWCFMIFQYHLSIHEVVCFAQKIYNILDILDFTIIFCVIFWVSASLIFEYQSLGVIVCSSQTYYYFMCNILDII